MHETRPAKITSPITSLNGGYVRTIPVALIVAAIGIGAALFMSLGSDDSLKRFMYSYLTSFCFVLSISMGCLFFVTIMHLTRAGWSVTIRRIAELWAMWRFVRQGDEAVAEIDRMRGAHELCAGSRGTTRLPLRSRAP